MSELLHLYERLAKREDAGRQETWVTLGLGLGSAVESLLGNDPHVGLDHALARLPERLREQASKAFKRGLPLCESPIERAVFPWLVCQSYQCFDLNPLVLQAGEGDELPRFTVAVVPQMRLGNRRADFVLAARRGGPVRLVVVECDGREFHDDAARDEARTQEILRNPRVLAVTRLTGARIFRDPRRAALDASAALTSAWSSTNHALAHKFAAGITMQLQAGAQL